MNTVDLLTALYRRVARGWCKGAPYRDWRGRWSSIPQRRACLTRALTETTSTWPEAWHLADLLEDELGPRGHIFNDAVQSLMYFNDRPSTTKSMVLALIDSAIEEATYGH